MPTQAQELAFGWLTYRGDEAAIRAAAATHGLEFVHHHTNGDREMLEFSGLPNICCRSTDGRWTLSVRKRHYITGPAWVVYGVAPPERGFPAHRMQYGFARDEADAVRLIKEATAAGWASLEIYEPPAQRYDWQPIDTGQRYSGVLPD